MSKATSDSMDSTSDSTSAEVESIVFPAEKDSGTPAPPLLLEQEVCCDILYHHHFRPPKGGGAAMMSFKCWSLRQAMEWCGYEPPALQDYAAGVSSPYKLCMVLFNNDGVEAVQQKYQFADLVGELEKWISQGINGIDEFVEDKLPTIESITYLIVISMRDQETRWQLEAVITFHAEKVGAYISWLLVTESHRRAKLGTFLVLMVQELVLFGKPQDTAYHSRLFTQVNLSDADIGRHLFWMVHLAFRESNGKPPFQDVVGPQSG